MLVHFYGIAQTKPKMQRTGARAEANNKSNRPTRLMENTIPTRGQTWNFPPDCTGATATGHVLNACARKWTLCWCVCRRFIDMLYVICSVCLYGAHIYCGAAKVEPVKCINDLCVVGVCVCVCMFVLMRTHAKQIDENGVRMNMSTNAPTE